MLCNYCIAWVFIFCLKKYILSNFYTRLGKLNLYNLFQRPSGQLQIHEEVMGDKVPSGDAKARNLVRARFGRPDSVMFKQLIDLQGKAQEELLALFQQDAARLQTHRNETPPARVERAKLVRSRLEWLDQEFPSISQTFRYSKSKVINDSEASRNNSF